MGSSLKPHAQAFVEWDYDALADAAGFKRPWIPIRDSIGGDYIFARCVHCTHNSYLSTTRVRDPGCDDELDWPIREFWCEHCGAVEPYQVRDQGFARLLPFRSMRNLGR